MLHLKKETHKAEGSFQVLNMDTICHWAVLKGRKIMGKKYSEATQKKKQTWGHVHKTSEQQTEH